MCTGQDHLDTPKPEEQLHHQQKDELMTAVMFAGAGSVWEPSKLIPCPLSLSLTKIGNKTAGYAGFCLGRSPDVEFLSNLHKS